MSDHFKTQDASERAVKIYSRALEFVPDWFVTQQQIRSWGDYDDYWDDNDKFFAWYDGYKKRKAQKAKIEELMPIA